MIPFTSHRLPLRPREAWRGRVLGEHPTKMVVLVWRCREALVGGRKSD